MAQNATKIDAASVLAILEAKASSNRASGYAGEISSEEAHDFLLENPGALVDVRTQQEWQSVGMPDLFDTQGKFAAVSWKINPGYMLNPNFAAQFESHAIAKDTPIFFMCKGGGRSLEAAKAMTAAGYRYCFNITGGYEGRYDMAGNVVSPGWSNSGLPCKKG
jgi:rhodanese-related sulfurtransferase